MTKELENKLFECKTISEFVTMFFGLGMNEKLSVFTEEVTVPQGMYFYRVRKAKTINDPYASSEWGPVPKEIAEQGRFNLKGESVLYIASTPDDLNREARLEEDEEYYLAKYICNKTFKVGSFLGLNSKVNTLVHRIAMAVSSTENLTDTENELIDEYYDLVKDKNLYYLSDDLLSSFYIHKMLPDLYDKTNKLAKLVLMKNKNGIRYASVYSPIEYSGANQLATFDGVGYGNYVLTQKGYENLELVSVEKKKAEKIQGLEVLISVFARNMM